MIFKSGEKNCLLWGWGGGGGSGRIHSKCLGMIIMREKKKQSHLRLDTCANNKKQLSVPRMWHLSLGENKRQKGNSSNLNKKYL